MTDDAYFGKYMDSLLKSQVDSILSELLAAQSDRQNGYPGRNARDVLADMKRIIG